MTEAIFQAMAVHEIPLVDALLKTLPLFHGAFSLAVMDRSTLVGVRDPHVDSLLIVRAHAPQHDDGVVRIG